MGLPFCQGEVPNYEVQGLYQASRRCGECFYFLYLVAGILGSEADIQLGSAALRIRFVGILGLSVSLVDAPTITNHRWCIPML